MAPDLHVVLRPEELGGAIVESWKCCYDFVWFLVIVVIDLPYTDFVVLVSAEEFVS